MKAITFTTPIITVDSQGNCMEAIDITEKINPVLASRAVRAIQRRNLWAEYHRKVGEVYNMVDAGDITEQQGHSQLVELAFKVVEQSKTQLSRIQS